MATKKSVTTLHNGTTNQNMGGLANAFNNGLAQASIGQSFSSRSTNLIDMKSTPLTMTAHFCAECFPEKDEPANYILQGKSLCKKHLSKIKDFENSKRLMDNI